MKREPLSQASTGISSHSFSTRVTWSCFSTLTFNDVYHHRTVRLQISDVKLNTTQICSEKSIKHNSYEFDRHKRIEEAVMFILARLAVSLEVLKGWSKMSSEHQIWRFETKTMMANSHSNARDVKSCDRMEITHWKLLDTSIARSNFSEVNVAADIGTQYSRKRPSPSQLILTQA